VAPWGLAEGSPTELRLARRQCGSAAGAVPTRSTIGSTFFECVPKSDLFQRFLSFGDVLEISIMAAGTEQ